MNEFDELIEVDPGPPAQNGDVPGPPLVTEPRNMRHDETIEEYLIAMWGEEEYFTSSFYKASVIEKERAQRLEPLRTAYLKAKA